jgi:hypothetical protein
MHGWGDVVVIDFRGPAEFVPVEGHMGFIFDGMIGMELVIGFVVGSEGGERGVSLGRARGRDISNAIDDNRV